jgi:ParB/Sulfiredoxin domain
MRTSSRRLLKGPDPLSIRRSRLRRNFRTIFACLADSTAPATHLLHDLRGSFASNNSKAYVYSKHMRNSEKSLHRCVSNRTKFVIIYCTISQLKLDPRNPRAHSKRQVRQIACSIEAFGFNVPILIPANFKVIAGHGRILAAQQLGLAEVPTILLDHLTEAQARAFMIADNRLTEVSVWNDELLAEQLRDLTLMDLDFSLEATGFEMGEIDLRIEGLEAGAAAERDVADDLPAASELTISRGGDLWLLGQHKIFCGNVLEGLSYMKLLGKEKASMVFTDPPYNVRIEGNVSGFGAVRHREFAMASGEMSRDEFSAFLTTVCMLLARHSAAGSIHFYCMDWRHMVEPRSTRAVGRLVCGRDRRARCLGRRPAPARGR